MEDKEIVELYWQRSDQAIAESLQFQAAHEMGRE